MASSASEDELEALLDIVHARKYLDAQTDADDAPADLLKNFFSRRRG